MIRSNIVKKALAKNSRRVVKPRDGRPAVEILPWSLYHQLTLAAAGAQTLTFYRSINAANLLQSNLVNGGFLPYPQSFDIFSICLAPIQGLNQVDLENFLNNSTVQLSLSNKPYLQIPMFRMPAGGGLHGMATTNNVFTAQNGLPAPSNTWSLAVAGMPLYLPSQQDYAVELRTFNTVNFTVAFNVTCYLDGVLARPVL
jgi:hypothetical protein